MVSEYILDPVINLIPDHIIPHSSRISQFLGKADAPKIRKTAGRPARRLLSLQRTDTARELCAAAESIGDDTDPLMFNSSESRQISPALIAGGIGSVLFVPGSDQPFNRISFGFPEYIQLKRASYLLT